MRYAVVIEKAKNNYLLICYCVYIIFLSASCSDFFTSVKAQMVFIFFSIIMLFKKRPKWHEERIGILLFFSFMLILFLQYLNSGVFMLGSVKFFTMLLCLYYIIRFYNLLFLKMLIDTIYFMSLISIPFYVLQLLNTNFLRSILSIFNFSFAGQASAGGVYVFLFNVSPDGWGEWYRNSGFMWEPGAFGGMLVFAMAFYFLYNNYQVNKRIIFLFLYSLTTVSTAAVFALLLFLALIIIAKYRKKAYMIVIGLLILTVVSIRVYTLPFMGDKMTYYSETNLDYKYVYSTSNFSSGTSSIGRFSGFLIEFDELKKNPLIGHGWDSDYSDLGIGKDWSNPSGLSVLMGKFGVVGLLFIIIGLYYYALFRGTGSIYQNLILFIIILIPVFSNPFQINLVFWSFVMMGIVNASKKIFLNPLPTHK